MAPPDLNSMNAAYRMNPRRYLRISMASEANLDY